MLDTIRLQARSHLLFHQLRNSHLSHLFRFALFLHHLIDISSNLIFIFAQTASKCFEPHLPSHFQRKGFQSDSPLNLFSVLSRSVCARVHVPQDLHFLQQHQLTWIIEPRTSIATFTIFNGTEPSMSQLSGQHLFH